MACKKAVYRFPSLDHALHQRPNNEYPCTRCMCLSCKHGEFGHACTDCLLDHVVVECPEFKNRIE